MTFLSSEGDGFTRATERCIGMGKCRSAEGGTMCPSYRATREERYSTRGRARLLSEMLRGEVITDGWQSEEVKEALDMCLACKGCRSDCPTHTDMASYKAEFLSHYYEQHARPLQAHSMGRIGEWAPLAMRAPNLVNALTGLPGFSGVLKRIAGIAPQRAAAALRASAASARSSTRCSAARRDPARAGGMRRGDPVILFPDTFSNYFRPQSALAAARVLEASGARVELPKEGLCCGRPYYDFGMLDKAKASAGEDPRRARAADRIRRAHRRARARLPFGVQGRAAEALPRRHATPRSCRGRSSRSPNCCRRATGSRARDRRQRAAARPLPPEGARQHQGRRRAAGSRRHRDRRRPRPAAAAWPAPSASGRRPTRPR